MDLLHTLELVPVPADAQDVRRACALRPVRPEDARVDGVVDDADVGNAISLGEDIRDARADGGGYVRAVHVGLHEGAGDRVDVLEEVKVALLEVHDGCHARGAGGSDLVPVAADDEVAGHERVVQAHADGHVAVVRPHVEPLGPRVVREDEHLVAAIRESAGVLEQDARAPADVDAGDQHADPESRGSSRARLEYGGAGTAHDCGVDLRAGGGTAEADDLGGGGQVEAGGVRSRCRGHTGDIGAQHDDLETTPFAVSGTVHARGGL